MTYVTFGINGVCLPKKEEKKSLIAMLAYSMTMIFNVITLMVT